MSHQHHQQQQISPELYYMYSNPEAYYNLSQYYPQLQLYQATQNQLQSAVLKTKEDFQKAANYSLQNTGILGSTQAQYLQASPHSHFLNPLTNAVNTELAQHQINQINSQALLQQQQQLNAHNALLTINHSQTGTLPQSQSQSLPPLSHLTQQTQLNHLTQLNQLTQQTQLNALTDSSQLSYPYMLPTESTSQPNTTLPLCSNSTLTPDSLLSQYTHQNALSNNALLNAANQQNAQYSYNQRIGEGFNSIQNTSIEKIQGIKFLGADSSPVFNPGAAGAANVGMIGQNYVNEQRVLVKDVKSTGAEFKGSEERSDEYAGEQQFLKTCYPIQEYLHELKPLPQEELIRFNLDKVNAHLELQVNDDPIQFSTSDQPGNEWLWRGNLFMILVLLKV